jgi:hypothetical protein
MRRELIEFSDLIDERFEPATTQPAEAWFHLFNWFNKPAAKNKHTQSAPKTYVTEQGRLISGEGLF